ncbi:MAG: M4 family metallopeptidase [Oscillospiraceae bacterium]|nr:M4 family metallopeptidase [Oscillospiraceae bacterium]
MKNRLKRIAASVSAICLAATFCTSLTASAVTLSPNTVTPKHGTFWNSYWHSNYGNIVLDYCRSNQDHQDYLYTPGRNIRAVSTSSFHDIISANYNDVLRVYGSDYQISQAGQCGLYNAEKAYDFLSTNGYTYTEPLYIAINDFITHSHTGDGARENAWAADNTIFLGMGSTDTTKENATGFNGSATDIVTHELMHLVTGKEIGWIDYGAVSTETTALMEAYSDILAELADEQHDWKFGATLFLNNSPAKDYCYRNIACPSATNNPDAPNEHYCTTYQEFTYFMAVYPNYQNFAAAGSTVISHAAYLMHEKGYSDQTLAKIWLKSISKYTTGTNAGFADCREAFFEAAVEVLSQIGGRYYIAQVFDLMSAFDEVGIYSRT